MMDVLSSVDDSVLSHATLCTLTYHHATSSLQGHRHLAAWLRRIRHRYASASYIWRGEPQRRGVLHYHVVLWLPRDREHVVHHEAWCPWLEAAWHSIADPHSPAHMVHGARCELVRSRSRTRAYVAKYVAKEADTPLLTLARRWGASYNLPRRPLCTVELSPMEFRRVVEATRRLLHGRVRRKRAIAGYVSGANHVRAYLTPRESLRILLEIAKIDPKRLKTDAVEPFRASARASPHYYPSPNEVLSAKLQRLGHGERATQRGGQDRRPL